jgi:hypothetical protein
MTSFPALRVGAALAAALLIASCGTISDSAIENVCNELCSDTYPSPQQATQACASTLEAVRDNAHAASCDDAFLAFFRYLERGDLACVTITNLGGYDLYPAVVQCIFENDPRQHLHARAKEIRRVLGS